MLGRRPVIHVVASPANCKMWGPGTFARHDVRDKRANPAHHQQFPLRSSSRCASSSDGSSHASPRRRRAPVKSGGRSGVERLASFLAVGDPGISRLLIRFCTRQAGPSADRRTAPRTPSSCAPPTAEARTIWRVYFSARSSNCACGTDLVHQTDAQRFLRVERLIGQQDLHRIGAACSSAGCGPVADPSLRQQREPEPRMFRAGDADVGGRQQDIQTGTEGRRHAAITGFHTRG